MLCMNSYPRAYVQQCRRLVDTQLAAYDAVLAATTAKGASRPKKLDAAIADFEHAFFNNMVLVLEQMFVHRTRGIEKKDGNPLNEVRVLATSILENGGVLVKDSQIKLDPGKSVLKLDVGDEIRLTQSDFVLLVDAFFAELDKKFVG